MIAATAAAMMYMTSSAAAGDLIYSDGRNLYDATIECTQDANYDRRLTCNIDLDAFEPYERVPLAVSGYDISVIIADREKLTEDNIVDSTNVVARFDREPVTYRSPTTLNSEINITDWSIDLVGVPPGDYIALAYGTIGEEALPHSTFHKFSLGKEYGNEEIMNQGSRITVYGNGRKKEVRVPAAVVLPEVMTLTTKNAVSFHRTLSDEQKEAGYAESLSFCSAEWHDEEKRIITFPAVLEDDFTGQIGCLDIGLEERIRFYVPSTLQPSHVSGMMKINIDEHGRPGLPNLGWVKHTIDYPTGQYEEVNFLLQIGERKVKNRE